MIRVIIHLYDGTREGLEKLCTIKKLSVYKFDFCFVDDKYNETSVFTGNVKIMDNGFTLILCPGDYYQERINDNETFEAVG